MLKSKQITDPKYRRLKKALRNAERFYIFHTWSPVAVGRWNKTVNKCRRIVFQENVGDFRRLDENYHK